MHWFLSRLALWLLRSAVLLVLPSIALAQAAAGVGFKGIRIQDPVTGSAMPGYVFYPSKKAGDSTRLGPYQLTAAADLPPLPGAKPLVVISHGHAGSNLGHHDLATYLAAHGFIVATLEHPGDNYHDSGGNGLAEVMGGRPIQVSATISMLLKDPHWRGLIDPDRIGVAGFSTGGYTSLLLVGAVPRFTRFLGYCERHPADQEICGLVQQLASQAGAARTTLERLQETYTHWGETRDPRIKAAFVMAPQSIVFDKGGLASVDRPVFLYYGTEDQVLLPAENAARIAPLIKTLVDVKTIPGAGHYVFIAPCSAVLANQVPLICKDPDGVDRAAVHGQINADALAFFHKTLNELPE